MAPIEKKDELRALLGDEAAYFEANNETVALVANSAPAVGTPIRLAPRSGRRQGDQQERPFECDMVFEYVFLTDGSEYLGVRAEWFPNHETRPIVLLAALKREGVDLYARAATWITRIARAATCAPVVRAMKTRAFSARLALAFAADAAHAEQMLACVDSEWQKTRIRLLRAGASLAPPVKRAAPGRARSITDEIREASPVARLMQGATALQLAALCVAWYSGPETLACVFAATTAGAAVAMAPATAKALGNGFREALSYLPESAQKVLVPPSGDALRLAHAVTSVLVGLELVHPLVERFAAGLAQAERANRPERAERPERTSGYHEPGLVLGAALTLARDVHAHAKVAPCAEDFAAIVAKENAGVARYLESVERVVRAHQKITEFSETIARLVGPGAVFVTPIAIKLAACALASLSGAWGPDVSFEKGTALSYIAWYNPVFAEALRFCTV
jgi:hypothetical protein